MSSPERPDRPSPTPMPPVPGPNPPYPAPPTPATPLPQPNPAPEPAKPGQPVGHIDFELQGFIEAPFLSPSATT